MTSRPGAAERVPEAAGAPAATSLSQAVRQHARQHPDAVAVGEPGLDLTYSDLRARADGLARTLAGVGVAPGSVVVAAVYSLSDLAVAAVASSSVGAVLYPFDIRKLLEARAGRVELVAPSAIVLAGVPDGSWTGACPVIYLDEVEPAADLVGLPAATGDAAGFLVESERFDAVVRLSWAGTLASVTSLSLMLNLTAADRLLAAAVTHADMVLLALLASLLGGGAAISPGPTAHEGDGLCRAIRRHDVSVLIAAPKSAVLLAEVADADRISFPGLRSVVLARDWVPQRLPASLYRAAGPDLEIFTAWGCAESGIITAAWRAGARASEFPAPLGAPLGDHAVSALGDGGLPGRAGELCSTGTSVAIGFVGRPDLAERYLRPAGAARAYRSGDWGRVSDGGRLELLTARLAGHADPAGRLRAAEELIETWLTVRTARLVVTSRGEIVAFVETVGGARIEPGELLADLRDRMSIAGSAGGALPALVITMPGLPVTATGVVDRASLAARAERLTSPGAAAPGAVAAREFPEGSGAARILKTVADVLGIPNLAPDMNLFEIGATSLEIVRVIDGLEAELDFDVELEELLEAPQVVTLISQYHAAHPPSPGLP
jgi:acyl-coenzyme A synthetase/AMP-(fatty) acid ligase/acyl carrier protein